jgi:hypothetical protein
MQKASGSTTFCRFHQVAVASLARMTSKRLDPGARRAENTADATQKRSKRADPGARRAENSADVARKRAQRSNASTASKVEECKCKKESRVRNKENEATICEEFRIGWPQVEPKETEWRCIREFLKATSLEENFMGACTSCGEIVKTTNAQILTIQELLQYEHLLKIPDNRKYIFECINAWNNVNSCQELELDIACAQREVASTSAKRKLHNFRSTTR